MKGSIAVIGLGFVGLPLAMLCSRSGYRVTGIDVDQTKLAKLHKGASYNPDISDNALNRLLQSGMFTATDQFEAIQDAEAIILCVPTPLAGGSEPDLSYLQAAVTAAIPYLQQGQLLIVESSTYPGTTEEVVKPLLESSGMIVGEDLFLGYSPERIDPGNLVHPLEHIPKVISGVTSACLKRVESLYGDLFRKVVPVSSPKTAEMTKMLENTYRFINISFINEISRVCHGLGIDVWEVIRSASTKPYGFTAYMPGPGVGGHCIPVDPLYLKWKANRERIDTSFIDLAKQINDEQPDYIVSRVKELLEPRSSARPYRILLVGVTYKANIDDTRESPAVHVFERLLKEGYQIDYHDPHADALTVSGTLFESKDLLAIEYISYDCVVLLVPHRHIDYERMRREASRIFDTRNYFAADYPNVYRL